MNHQAIGICAEIEAPGVWEMKGLVGVFVSVRELRDPVSVYLYQHQQKFLNRFLFEIWGGRM